jgi:hypothetical protein
MLRDARSRGASAPLEGVLLSMNTLFMVRVQRRFRSWGLRMRREIHKLSGRAGETECAS